MKQKRRWLSMLLAICLMVATLPTGAALAASNLDDMDSPADTWDNHAADSFAGGTGTKEDPYQIATAEQLAKLANDVNDKTGSAAIVYTDTYFVLTADIDLSEYRWKPIGVYQEGIANSRFSGCLDGKGYTISGLYVDERESGLSAGLFGCIGAISEDIQTAPTVKNLTIDGAEIYASDDLPDQYSVRGYAAILTGVTTHYYSKTIIENVHVSGKISTSYVTGSGVLCGGMIGNCNNLMATNCSADVEIVGDVNNTSGGFAGFVVGGKFENCTARGSLDGRWGLGGFAGEVQRGETNLVGDDPIIDSELNKCVSYVDITATDWNAGGFVGYFGEGTISNCASYGKVTSEVTDWNPKIGGFAGTNAGTIQYSHTVSAVTESHETFEAGGFVGNDNNGTTIACSFDSTQNAQMNAIGGSEAEGENEIASAPTATVLANICRDVFVKHSMAHFQAAEATCENAGNKEYWHCSVCNKNFSDENGITEVTDVSIPATGHTFSAEWQTTEEQHWRECSCGAKTEESNHAFAWKIDKEAGAGIAGIKHEECIQCGYAKEAVEIPALEESEYPPVIDDTDGGKVTVTPENPQAGDEVTITTTPEDGKTVDKVIVTDTNGKEITVTDNKDGTYTFVQPDGAVTVKVTFKAEKSKPATDKQSPQTGDDSNITLWIAVLLMAGAGLTGTTIYSRRKKKYSK